MFNKLAKGIQNLSPDLRKIINNIAWLFTDQIFRMVLGLIVGIWVARYLGPKQFGLYSYVITFVSMFSPLASFGISTVVIRDLSRKDSCKEETIGSAFLLECVGGILTLLLSVFLIVLLKPGDTLTHWLVGIIAIGTIVDSFEVIDFWFRSQIQAKYTVIARNLTFILITVVRVVLLQIHAPLIAFVCAKLIESVISAIGAVVTYHRQGQNLMAWRVRLDRTKQLFRESLPLVFSGITIYIYSKIDQIMLGSFFKDQSELGFYSAAVKISECFDFLPVIIASSILPKLTQLKEQSEDEYRKKFQAYFDVMLLLWLAVAIPVSICSSFLVNLLYGASYATSATILSIYVWAQFGTNFGVARSNFFAIEGKLKWALYISISGAVINFLLNLYLIPKLGAIGATVATLVTYFIVNVLFNFLFQDLRFVGMLILRSLNLPKAVSRIYKLVK